MTKSSKERRKYLRIYRNFIISYREKGKSTVMLDVSQVNNLSKGGLNFSSSHPLKKGVIVVINLKTPLNADAIHLEGIVLECKAKISELIYEVRLEFQGISEQELAVLKKIEEYDTKANPKGQ